MKKFICIDGNDACGKTTLLNNIYNYYTKQNIKVLLTRAIGGEKNSDLDKIRKFLFKSNIKNIELEEEFFAISAYYNIKNILNFFNANKNSIVLQDRGLFSHYAFGASKGLNVKFLDNTYKKVIQSSKEVIKVTQNNSHIILMTPTPNSKWLLKRIESRDDTDKKAHSKYENYVVQEQVRVMAANGKPRLIKQTGFKIHYLPVSETDSICNVFDKFLDLKI